MSQVKKIGVVFGGPSPEHDVSVLTGLQAARELERNASRTVSALYWSKAGEWFEVDPALEAAAFAEGVPSGASPLRLMVGSDGGFAARAALGRQKPLPVDAVLNCCHGGPGEDGSLQAVLDLAGIPHAGPTVAGAALGMDKLAFGALVTALGLPALPRALLTSGEPVSYPGPYIVKPRFGGSSIGIEVVDELATARALLSASPHLRTGAVVEPYRGDLFDLNIAVRSWPDLSLSAIERPIRAGQGNPGGAGEIFGYADKYVPGVGMTGAPRELPARIDPVTEKRIREAAAAVADVCGVRGVARLDFLSDGNEIYVNEINTIPGSLARHLWIEPQLGFGELLEFMLGEAIARPTASYTTAGADGSVLAAAGSISAKLG